MQVGTNNDRMFTCSNNGLSSSISGLLGIESSGDILTDGNLVVQRLRKSTGNAILDSTSGTTKSVKFEAITVRIRIRYIRSEVSFEIVKKANKKG